jgi:hypothetical protein
VNPGNDKRAAIYDTPGFTVAVYMLKDDAEFVVQAVNSHGALVAALQGLILEQSLTTITQARKALKEAGE